MDTIKFHRRPGKYSAAGKFSNL